MGRRKSWTRGSFGGSYCPRQCAGSTSSPSCRLVRPRTARSLGPRLVLKKRSTSPRAGPGTTGDRHGSGMATWGFSSSPTIPAMIFPLAGKYPTGVGMEVLGAVKNKYPCSKSTWPYIRASEIAVRDRRRSRDPGPKRVELDMPHTQTT